MRPRLWLRWKLQSGSREWASGGALGTCGMGGIGGMGVMNSLAPAKCKAFAPLPAITATTAVALFCRYNGGPLGSSLRAAFWTT